MLKDNQGNYSLTKLISLVAFVSFILVSVYVLVFVPDQFDYRVFSFLTGIGSFGSRIADKMINVFNCKGKGEK